MGAGKTTIGRDLANSMNFKFIDLDEYIEKKENSTVFDIFNKKGDRFDLLFYGIFYVSLYYHLWL